MNKIKTTLSLATIALLSLTSISSFAERQSGERKPPQEAFDACKNQTEGASVIFTTKRGSLSATCQSKDGQLVAVPVKKQKNHVNK